MSIVLRTAQSDAIGFAPIAGVPPVGRQPVSDVDAGGTPNPLRSKGSEFNQLAPHAPEWLIAPRAAMSRQHRVPRAPPVLDGMARHWSWHSCPSKITISSAIEHVYGVTMSDKNKSHYTSRLSVHITPAMSDRLDQIALMHDEAKAEIVRSALRAYLDEQEDLLSSRRHFTKMFQRRVHT